jgi:hypothetical protein
MRRFASLVVAAGLSLSLPGTGASRVVELTGASVRELPSRLSDQAFWRLSVDASEPGGYFRSQDITNLTSNEIWYQTVIPELVERAGTGGVYLGVGPEQNFTYIAALRPKMAVVFDVRRGNFNLQLMYKALFELATDRAEFLSMLFGRPKLAGVSTTSSAEDLFRALEATRPTDAVYQRQLLAIEDRLVRGHGFPLRAADLGAIRTIYQTFYYSGVAVRASPTYEDLMTATDSAGVNRSYLASEQGFGVVKDLESRNLVVPVVGDFAGPKAVKTIGGYLRIQGGLVSAFYLSNVEDYLYGRWDLFCRNVASLPIDASSTFIRTANRGGFGRGAGFVTMLGSMLEETRDCR